MNSLQIDENTGFLESDNANSFNSARKIQFLELAKEFKNQGKFPKVSTICDQININITTFERHLDLDPAFKEAWQEISTHIEYQAISDMHELRTKNPMYMFGLLRYLNPKRWNPDSKMQISVDYRAITGLADKADAVDAEVCPVSAPKTIDVPTE